MLLRSPASRPNRARPSGLRRLGVVVPIALLAVTAACAPARPATKSPAAPAPAPTTPVRANDVATPAPPTTAAKPPATTPPTSPPTTAAKPPTTTPPTTTPPATVPPLSGKGAKFGINGQQFPLIDLGSWKYSVDRSVELGMKWIRGDWPPSRVPPLAASWTASDTALDYAQAHGLKVIVELHGDGPTPPAPSKLANEGSAIVSHYKSRNPGEIGAVEVWNEPNLNLFWSPLGDGTAYAAVVKAVYPAVKAADPTMTVLAGAMSPGPGSQTSWGYPEAQFLTNAYNAGMGGNFDALSYHPYSPNDAPGSINNALGALDRLHSIMVAHGDDNKQIWSTEAGASTASQSEAAQATAYTNYINAVTNGSRPWLGVMIFHNARDTGGEQFGIWRADGTPKAVVATIKKMLGA